MNELLLQAKINRFLKSSKNGEAVGPYQIPVETLKCVNYDILHILLESFIEVYKTGYTQTMVTLHFLGYPKTTNAQDCSE